MASKVTRITYLDRDNHFTITVHQDNEPVNFSQATSIELIVDGTIITQGIEWNAQGVLTFDIGDENLTPGTYRPMLVAYDPLHPDGQVIFDKDAPAELVLVVV